MPDRDPEPLRILQLEDHDHDALLVREALAADGLACEVDHARTRAEFEAALKREKPDIILSDFALPGFDGMAALELAQAAAPEVPFIFVSGTLGEETAIAAVKRGATDYVLKHRLSHLAPAVRRAIAESQERAVRQQTEEALRDSERQLRHAQKMEAVGRLAAGVAHDFNNLLTAILGFTHLARMKLGADHPALSDLKEIRKAGERAAGLTRQLLAFSRQQVLQPRPVDLNAMIVGLERMLRRLIGADVECVIRPADGIDSIVADPGQMEQVLLNLAVNARDAMPQGGRLTIETAATRLGGGPLSSGLTLPAGRYVMLAVSDDGIGMSETVRSRIFEPFYTTKEPGKGTGLGLSTVFGIVSQSGGGIDVYSEPGRGTTFKVYLPASERSSESGESEERVPSDLSGSETILVVEDEDAVRSFIAQSLTLQGYRVHVAEDGTAGLRLLEALEETVDLLLTDIVMPGLNAREFMDRAASMRPHMRMLCMSGYAEGAVLHHAVVVNRTSFLQKPFSSEALQRKVREVLDSDQQAAA